jgi:glycosyltransferase involved in cell wall biosynthesis
MEKIINFSVIIPLYNKANYIQKTLKSVLAQTFTEFEVVVVNDGSTDNSLNEAISVRDERVRIFTKQNEGVSVARNFGIEKAQFEYIAFLDADDFWLPHYLENINKLIKLYPNAGIFATTYFTNKLSDDVANKKNEIKFSAENTLLITDYCRSLVKNEIIPLWTGALCVNKKTINEAGLFPVGVKRGEDLDTWLRLSLKNSIALLNSPHVIYNQITVNNATRNYHSYRESFSYWKWYNYGNSPYLKKFTTGQIIALMQVALKNRNYNDTVKLFFMAKGMYRIQRRLLLLAKAIFRF